jgi:hypothetical protein
MQVNLSHGCFQSIKKQLLVLPSSQSPVSPVKSSNSSLSSSSMQMIMDNINKQEMGLLSPSIKAGSTKTFANCHDNDNNDDINNNNDTIVTPCESISRGNTLHNDNIDGNDNKQSFAKTPITSNHVSNSFSYDRKVQDYVVQRFETSKDIQLIIKLLTNASRELISLIRSSLRTFNETKYFQQYLAQKSVATKNNKRLLSRITTMLSPTYHSTTNNPHAGQNTIENNNHKKKIATPRSPLQSSIVSPTSMSSASSSSSSSSSSSASSSLSSSSSVKHK